MSRRGRAETDGAADQQTDDESRSQAHRSFLAGVGFRAPAQGHDRTTPARGWFHAPGGGHANTSRTTVPWTSVSR